MRTSNMLNRCCCTCGKRCVIFGALVLILYLCSLIFDSIVSTHIATRVKETQAISEPESSSSFSPIRVLLVAYYRGGSSFLGDIFRNDDRATYWFEPLLFTQQETGWAVNALRRDKSLSDNRREQLIGQRYMEMQKDFNFILDSIYKCKIDEVYRKHNEIVKWSTQRDAEVNIGLKINSELMKIFPKFSKECLSSGLIVVKSIRVRMRMAEAILQRFPDMKVVYYTRHPGGIVKSQTEVEKPTQRNNLSEIVADTQQIRAVCNEMGDDLRHYFKLKEKYPLHFHWFRYEDLAMKPTETVFKLYQFLGTNHVPSKVGKWLNEATHASQAESRDAYGTKKNSSDIVNKWRKQLTGKSVGEVEDICEDLIQKLRFHI